MPVITTLDITAMPTSEYRAVLDGIVGDGLARALCRPSRFRASSWLICMLLAPTPAAVAQAVAAPLPTPRTLERQEGKRGQDAFMKAYQVLLHPRCQNCHPAGDTPLQGDDSHVHDLLRLRRGADGNGVFAMRCSNCHQAANAPGPHTPPGAPSLAGNARPAEPRWHLPPPNTPMVFQGRTPAQLCRQLKDPKQNGGLTPERLVHHVNTDPLVLWGWNPGEGRTTPSVSHEEFVAAVKEWLDAGGTCPP